MSVPYPEALSSTLASGDHPGKGHEHPPGRLKDSGHLYNYHIINFFHHVETHSKLNEYSLKNKPQTLYIQYSRVQTGRDISPVVESTFQLLSRARQHCGLIEWSWQDGIQLILDLAPL